MTEDMLGRAARVSVSKERTTMIATGDHTDEVAERIKIIKAEIEQTDSEFDKEKAQVRHHTRPCSALCAARWWGVLRWWCMLWCDAQMRRPQRTRAAHHAGPPCPPRLYWWSWRSV
jgi:hypothetical protein